MGHGASCGAFEKSIRSFLYRQLYQEAQAGNQGTYSNGGVQRTVTATLVGQGTLDGEPVYELRFDEQVTVPGSECAPESCQPASFALLLHLDATTCPPVRTVLTTINPDDNPAGPGRGSATATLRTR